MRGLGRAAGPGGGRTPNELTFDNVAITTEESRLRVNGTLRNIEGETQVVDVQASSEKLALNELAKLLPALRGYALQPAFDVTAKGPVDRMAVDLSLRDAQLGAVKADMTVDALAPRRLTGTARVDRFNVRSIVRDGARRPNLTSDITGNARFDLTLPEGKQSVRGSYAVDIDRVRFAGYDARNVVSNGRFDNTTLTVNARGDAYGGHTTAAGTVRMGAPLTLDLRGRATNVDLRNLPPMLRAPKASSTLQFAYTLSVRGTAFKGDVTLDRSTLAGAAIVPGATGTFSFGAGAPTYSAKGEVSGVDLQRIGREFDIPALTTDRYRGTINGPFDMTGSGGGKYPLTLDVTGTLVFTTLVTFRERRFTQRACHSSLHLQPDARPS